MNSDIHISTALKQPWVVLPCDTPWPSITRVPSLGPRIVSTAARHCRLDPNKSNPKALNMPELERAATTLSAQFYSRVQTSPSSNRDGI